MTAPAAAPASGPIAPAVARLAPRPPADPFAFAAVLDSLPGAAAKADPPAAGEEQPVPSNDTARDEPSGGQTGRHSLLNDSALLSALPFALRAASTMNERRQAADSSPSLASPAMKAPKSESSGASLVAGGKAATVGRLVGERAFHFGAATSAGMIASRTLAINTPFAPSAASAADLAARWRTRPDRRLFAGRASGESLGRRRSADRNRRVPDGGRRSLGRASNTSRGRHAGGRARSRAQRTKGRGLRASACRPGRDLRGSPRASGIKRQGGRRSASRSGYLRRAASSANRPVRRAAVGAFRRRGGVPIRWLDLQRPTRRRRAPRERARPWLRALDSADPRDRCRSFARRPRGCLDDDANSSGDKLSVVIRAASSHTLGTIEGARDAIADRMAAIQPLNSLVFKQTGANIDGNANGNASSADGGSSGGGQRPTQGGDSNDALSRRGAGRDRSF